MSIWTHVAGVARVDDICFDGKHYIDLAKLKRRLGRMALWEDEDAEESWDKCKLPLGSEGSVEYTLDTNPDNCCLSAHVLTVWGNLRDYQDIEGVVKWWKKTLRKLSLRQAVLTVTVESYSQVVICWDTANRRWKRYTIPYLNSKQDKEWKALINE